MSPSDQRLPLTQRQFLTIVAIGITVWFGGALFCRWMGAIGAFEGTDRIILYAALIPGSVPLIWLLQYGAALRRDQLALGASIGTAAAITLDGLALAWFPALYGPGVAQTAASGAAILWGGAVIIWLGCWMNRVPQQ